MKPFDFENDALIYEEAIQHVIKNGGGSTALLQRKFKIGYGKALRLLERMTEEGILAQPEGNLPRKLIIRENT